MVLDFVSPEFSTNAQATLLVVRVGTARRHQFVANAPASRDSNWPFGGIVIYKVDENADRQRARGYPGHMNWPTDHYM